MKKLMAMLLLAGSIQGVYAQKTEKKEMFLENKSLYEELTNVQKKTDKFNLYLNMQGSFDANFRDGFDEGVFKMRQLRIEAKGNLNSWLSYRYRQRLNRSNEGGGMIDNIPTSIDYAGIGVKLNDQFSFFAGKQCTAYGGFEFDLNPIDIYQYSDMIENMSNFTYPAAQLADPEQSQQFVRQDVWNHRRLGRQTSGPQVGQDAFGLYPELEW